MVMQRVRVGTTARWGWATAVLVAGVALGAAGPAAWAQTATPGVPGPSGAQAPVVPEIVEPRQAPTLPPGSGGDRGLSTPRSENPQAPLDGARPLPDGGVLTPPAPGSPSVIRPPATGQTPVIRPPATGDMPVIAPPGTPGGDRSVVPR